MYTQNTTQKSWDHVLKRFILNLEIAGPCNSTEKNPPGGKKLNYKQLFVAQIHTTVDY